MTNQHRGCGIDCVLPAGHLGDHIPPHPADAQGRPAPLQGTLDERLFPQRKQMSNGDEGLKFNDLMTPPRLRG